MTWPTDNRSRWGVTTSRGPFLVSVAPRRWRCQALCNSSRTAVYFCLAFVFASRAGPNCRTCLSRLCVDAGLCYRRVLRAVTMTISSSMPARTLESETNVTYGDERDRWWFVLKEKFANTWGNNIHPFLYLDY